MYYVWPFKGNARRWADLSHPNHPDLHKANHSETNNTKKINIISNDTNVDDHSHPHYTFHLHHEDEEINSMLKPAVIAPEDEEINSLLKPAVIPP